MNLRTALFIIGLLSTGLATASVIGMDNFESYSTGGLNGANGGYGWNGGWNAVDSVLDVMQPSTELDYDVPGGSPNQGGDRSLRLTGSNDTAAYRQLSESFGDDAGEDEFYVSMLLRFDAGTPINNLFAVLWADDTASGAHTDAPNMGLKMNEGDGSGPDDLMARLNLQSEMLFEQNIGNPPTSTYMLTARFFKDTNPDNTATYNKFTGMEFWVNPTQDDENTPDASGTYQGSGLIESFDYIGFRTVNLNSGAEVLVDNVVFGTTFVDVIPEPVVASLIALFGIAQLAIRRIFY
jgi:hypothetical protein